MLSKRSIVANYWRTFAGPVSIRAATTNVVWVASERVADLLLTTLINVIVVNHLGPDRYGPLSYAMSIASVASVAVTLGADEIIVSEIASRLENVKSILSAGLLARLMAAVLFCPVCAAVILLTRSVRHFDPWLAVIALQPLAIAFAVPPLLFRAQLRAGRTFQLRCVTLVFGAVSRAIGVWLNFDTAYFAGIVVAETSLLSLSGWIIAALAGLHHSSLSFDRAAALALIKRALPLMFGSLASIVYLQLDIFMVFQLAGPAEGGVYAVASKLALLAYSIPVILFNALMPLALRDFYSDYNGAAERVRMLLSLAFWVSVGIAIIIARASNLIINLMFSPAFAEAAALLRILAIAVPFCALGSGTMAWLVMRRGQAAALHRTIAGLAVSAAGCAIMIPIFGSSGAAAATVAAFAVAGFFVTPFLGEMGQEAFGLQLAAILLRPVRLNIADDRSNLL